MDLTSPTQLSELLRRHGFRTKKRFGQNFLVDRNIVNKILDSADIDSGDSVLEVGPGAGTLTQAIAERGAKVVAVEVDRDLIAILTEVLSSNQNAEVVNTDFLTLDLPAFLEQHFGGSKVKLIGNLPYYITSPIITKVLEVRDMVNCLILMVQKEVAERVKANPGTKDFGSMSVYIQYYCKTELIAQVSKNVFFPPPDVSSSVVKLTPRSEPIVEVPSNELFFDVVHCAFGQRRKTLLNSLSDCQSLGLGKEQIAKVLKAAQIDPTRRAETLSLEEFASIARSIASKDGF